jgi:hypothetical protein
MFHEITIVHLFFLGAFAALGLKGLIEYQGKRVSFGITVAGQTAVRVTYSDIVFLFSALVVMSLDDTSIEFFTWASSQLKSGPKFASVVVLSVYSTALVCALAYAFAGVVTIFGDGVVWLFQKGRASIGK